MNDVKDGPGVRPLHRAEEDLVRHIVRSDAEDERVTLIVGTGLGERAVPTVGEVVDLAERYAAGRGDDGDLLHALRQARDACGSDGPAVYHAYREVFRAWTSASDFDAVAQQAVLAMYRPPDRLATAIRTHGLWQPVTMELGEELEDDVGSWQLSAGLRALATVLVRKSDVFGDRVLTTNVDPLLEIAIRAAGGRAVSHVADGSHGPAPDPGLDAIEVHHLHGFWRPLLPVRTATMTGLGQEDPDAVEVVAGRVADLLDGDSICVLGAGDHAGTIRAAIDRMPRPVPVLWAVHRDAPAPARADLAGRPGITLLAPVDSDRILPELAERLGVPVPAGSTPADHQVRHASWERIFVSQPNSVPPKSVPDLLRELERRFAWKVQWAEHGATDDDSSRLLFWPIRLRRRTSVIHMAQAFAAGALAARHARLVISLDDFGIDDAAALRSVFEADLRRWITHIAPGAEPEFWSLSEAIDRLRTAPAPDNLLRPIDPWSVARDFYGRHNPTLYTVLAAVKAVPNLSLQDLDRSGDAIVQALHRRTADRLLTPMTMWAFLHYLLLGNPSSALITLGGLDEGLFWEQWRQLYGFGISQLYNPRIKSLSHESGLLRWTSRAEQADHLARVRKLPNWDDEGSYIPWLFQNAVLLPTYLTGRPVPVVDGHHLDSWAAFAAALDDGLPVLDLLADRATTLYRGPEPD